MAISILTPTHSFVSFSSSDEIESCNFPDIELCLPVYADNDVAFQFVLETTTEAEADDLCDLQHERIAVGIVDGTASGYGCDDGFLLEFTGEKPQRFRISTRQVLYNWTAGLPGFATVVSRGECFMIKIVVDGTDSFCSNCFQRIGNPCHTSVIEYGNDDNFAGFNYCNSEGEDSGGDTPVACDPTFITFTNIPYLTIPYTAALSDVYGNFPTIDVWIYDENNELVQMLQRTTLDNYPPTQIHADFGGNSSGIIRIS